MPGLTIVGTGRYVPGDPVTNEMLARVMDTSDEWIRQRTGISQRHFAPEGVGAGRSPQEWLWPGDVVEAEVTGIGRLRHPVVAI